MSSDTAFLLAVDLGGTKVAAALLTSAGEILARRQEPTLQEGPQSGIQQIAHLLSALTEAKHLGRQEIAAVGVGIPAVLESGSDLVVWAPNLVGWETVDLRQSLQEALGRPVFVEYDGHTAVLGEWWQGAGRGFSSIVDVIIGTGIGGGMILDSHLYRGNDRLAGAAGWFAMTADPEMDHPFARSRGFWEALAAGPGFARFAAERLAAYPESSLYALRQNGPLTPAQVFQAAAAGDSFAQKMLAELAGWLGLGVANIVSLVNPQLVILGGGIGSQCAPLLPRIRQVVERWAQPISARGVQLVCSTLGADAGLYGAAYAALLRLGEAVA